MEKKCPFCNQIIREEGHTPFSDSAPCGACQMAMFPKGEGEKGEATGGPKPRH